jgi:hypothetical protein
MVMDEKNVAEKNVAEEHDEALEIADKIDYGHLRPGNPVRVRVERGAAAIRAYRDRAVDAAKAEERRAWVEALAPGNRETGLGKYVMEHGASAMAEHVTEVTKLRIKQAVAETKARAEAAEAKVKTLASLINSDVVASMSTPEGLQPINSTEMRYAVDKWDSAEAKVRELEKHLSEARAENANDSTMKHFMAELNRLRIESLDTQLDSAVAKVKALEAKLAATPDRMLEAWNSENPRPWVHAYARDTAHWCVKWLRKEVSRG